LKVENSLRGESAVFMEVDSLSNIYKEIAEFIDVNTAVRIHELFKGQQIIFPKQLYSHEYIYSYIGDHYNGKNIRELAQKFGYSDRRIRQILRKEECMK